MTTIRDLLERDLRRRIEEIIKVDQVDEQSVYDEITEYVATPKIRDQYYEVLKAIAEAPAEPSEGVGVWISGFFGSGKSSFAKNLGYVLADRRVLGQSSAGLLKDRVNDKRLADLIDFINRTIPTEVVMFDVSAVRDPSQRMAEVMYTMLLRHLDYAEDYDVADLEIELESEGKLGQFVGRCQEKYGDWRTIRKGAQKVSRASAILHEMESATYPGEDSWAKSVGFKPPGITVGKLVERAFELMARRRPGKALTFIIDEVGQYVALSADKIDDLRAVVEQFGKESKNRLRRREAVAPVWVVVTSQEKLEEVVRAIDSQRVELARLQDRFKYRVDLSPADIREVASRRVLAKKREAVPLLRQLFAQAQGQINTVCRLERTARRSEVSEQDFIQFYPYLPHFVELSIDIVSGIRLQAGAPRHLGGSNRTIIKQAYEMLVSDRTRMADRPAGALVTLDMIYELVEGNLSTERKKDIDDIMQRCQGDAEDRGWATRVAKVICLLEYVRDLPRTEGNIGALLVDGVGRPGPIDKVKAALGRLAKAQFIRDSEEGWKLQSAQEKNWGAERSGHTNPRPKDREGIKRELLEGLFADPKLRTYRYRDLKSFRVGIAVDGLAVGDQGQVTLSIVTADDAQELSEKLTLATDESRTEGHSNDACWVFALTPEIDELVAQLHASRQMVRKYEQLRSQSQISGEGVACLDHEKYRVKHLESRLQDKLSQAMVGGQAVFRGMSRDGSGLGKTLPESVKGFLDYVVPDVYHKLEMGARPVKGDEVDKLLEATSLGALPPVFYDGPDGLNLVVREGTKFVPNRSAPAAQEILLYLKNQHAYGNRVTGKNLEEQFGGVGYGWERDMLRLVLGTLLRAGSIEIIYKGRRFTDHQDPDCRAALTNNVAFKAASFAPRKAVDLNTLTAAVKHYEDMAGTTVEPEEARISAAFKQLAADELDLLVPVEAVARANRLPVLQTLEEYRQRLREVESADKDECVRILAGQGASFKADRHGVRDIREALTEANLTSLREAGAVLTYIWPELRARGENGDLAARAAELERSMASPDFLSQMSSIKKNAAEMQAAYRAIYAKRHDERSGAFSRAVEEVKGLRQWGALAEGVRASVLVELTRRACEGAELAAGGAVCSKCGATLAQMESDLAALNGLKTGVLARIEELMRPGPGGPRVVRVRLAEVIGGTLDSPEAVDEALERLGAHLHKLVDEGVRIVLE